MRDLPAFLKAAYILLPVLAWLPSIPALSTVLYEVENRSPVAAILWGATVGGLLAAPGYLYALLSERVSTASRELRIAIRVSLLLGGFAAAVGIPFGLFFAWPVASLPLLSAAMCAHLIVRCERRWGSPKVAALLVCALAAWSILVAAAIFALPYLDRPAA